MSVKGDRDWIDRGMTSLQEKSINKVARQTRNLKNEQYRIIDDHGNVVFQKQGEDGRVRLTRNDRMFNIEQGYVTIHNHPGQMGGAFSGNDLYDFAYGARAIVVSTHEGKYYLINKKHGTREQRNGWIGLKDALEKLPRYRDLGLLEKREVLNRIPRVARIRRELADIARKWEKAKDSGKPQAVLNKYYDSYNKKLAVLDKVKAHEDLKVQVNELNAFYRDNASKYGFAYQFIKW